MLFFINLFCYSWDEDVWNLSKMLNFIFHFGFILNINSTHNAAVPPSFVLLSLTSKWRFFHFLFQFDSLPRIGSLVLLSSRRFRFLSCIVLPSFFSVLFILNVSQLLDGKYLNFHPSVSPSKAKKGRWKSPFVPRVIPSAPSYPPSPRAPHRQFTQI